MVCTTHDKVWKECHCFNVDAALAWVKKTPSLMDQVIRCHVSMWWGITLGYASIGRVRQVQTALEVSITDSVTCQSLCFFVANVAGESVKKQNKDRFIARMDAWRKKRRWIRWNIMKAIGHGLQSPLIWPQDVESQNLFCVYMYNYLYYIY